MLTKRALNQRRFGSVVVITSASHAEGPEFESRSNLEFYYIIVAIINVAQNVSLSNTMDNTIPVSH